MWLLTCPWLWWWGHDTTYVIQYMGVSENGRTPKSSNLIGISITNHPFWGTPIFGNIHMVMTLKHKFGNIMHSDQPNGDFGPPVATSLALNFTRHLHQQKLKKCPSLIKGFTAQHVWTHYSNCRTHHQCSFNHVSSPSFLGLARWLHFSLPMSRHDFDHPPIVPASHFDTK